MALHDFLMTTASYNKSLVVFYYSLDVTQNRFIVEENQLMDCQNKWTFQFVKML